MKREWYLYYLLEFGSKHTHFAKNKQYSVLLNICLLQFSAQRPPESKKNVYKAYKNKTKYTMDPGIYFFVSTKD